MATTKQIRNDRWNTYATTGYTHDVANDQASAGGVHLHQVRRSRRGWQKRVVQSNGNHRAAGPVLAISDTEGAELFARAKKH